MAALLQFGVAGQRDGTIAELLKIVAGRCSTCKWLAIDTALEGFELGGT